jgi:CDP-L-myo-inositol myo-inositolphosphotransferase
MKAVILAAGRGSRFGGNKDTQKVLTEVLGQTLLERSLATLREIGIKDFVVITGFKAEAVEAFIKERRLNKFYNITIVRNDEWQKGSARSVLAAQDFAGPRFLMAMGDHLFDPESLRGLRRMRGEFIGVFDSDPKYVDIEEATKTLSHRGHAKKVGKRLEEFKYVDAGLFICTQEIFPVVDKCLAQGKGEWNDVKREWLKEHEIHIYDLHGAFWLDIDTEGDRGEAERLLLERLGRPRDGIISKYLNRPISTRFSRWLVRTPLTPNQISFSAFLLGALAAFFLSTGQHALLVAGGVLAQVCSLLDGCDGEVARLRGEKSSYGAWFDAILDRMADALLIFGMTYGLYTTLKTPWSWWLGFLALGGSLLVSYSESRYEVAFRIPFLWDGFGLPVKRDARLLMIMLAGLFNQVALVLLIIGLLSLAEVVRRLVVGYLRSVALL